MATATPMPRMAIRTPRTIRHNLPHRDSRPCSIRSTRRAGKPPMPSANRALISIRLGSCHRKHLERHKRYHTSMADNSTHTKSSRATNPVCGPRALARPWHAQSWQQSLLQGGRANPLFDMGHHQESAGYWWLFERYLWFDQCYISGNLKEWEFS
jgi:hypothetical protein